MNKLLTLKKLLPSLRLSASSLGSNKRLLPEGRAWLYIGEIGTGTQTLALEWHLWRESRHCGMELSLNAVDGDHGVRLMLALPHLFALWFTIEKVPERWLPGHLHPSSLRPGETFWYAEQRNIGMRFFDWTIWVSLWEKDGEWNRSDPWWWQFSVNLPDLVMGQTRYSDRTLQEGPCLVPMPEGDYFARYRVFESQWRRPRWPWQSWPKHMMRIEIENDEGIPLPGKGTTSYNCDDDASFSTTMPYDGSVAAAAEEYVQNIVQDRLKRCGREVYP